MNIGTDRVQDNKRTFSMNGSQVSVLEQGHKVGLGSLLERHHSRGLEAKVGLQGGKVSDVVCRAWTFPSNWAQCCEMEGEKMKHQLKQCMGEEG